MHQGNTLLVSLAMLLFECHLVLGQPAGDEHIAKMKEAFSAAVERVTSGTGSGIFEQYEAMLGAPPALTSMADVSVVFKGGKYRVELAFRRKKGDILDRRVIICDKTAVVHADFWIGVPHPTGAEGCLNEAKGDYNPPTSAEFRWDVSCLPQQILDPIEFFPRAKNLSFERRGRRILGTSQLAGDAQFSFEADEDAGFNVVKR